MAIQALGILNSIAMQKNVNRVRTAENDFKELFEKITGGVIPVCPFSEMAYLKQFGYFSS